ncbi:MAG: CBS domain-containing protein, partial [Terriglobia bacterium]
EMTQDYRIILPLMFACVVSDLVAWTLQPDSIYTRKLTRRGVQVVQDMEVDVLARVRVGEVMDQEVETVAETDSIREAYDKTLASGRKALPVVNEHRELTGIITHFDLSRAFQSHEVDRPVSEFASRQLVTAYPDQTLYEVMHEFSQVRQLPVVDRRNHKHLLGMLNRADLLKIHGRQIAS